MEAKDPVETAKTMVKRLKSKEQISCAAFPPGFDQDEAMA